MTLIFMNLNNVPFVKYSHLTEISYLLCSSSSLHDAVLLLWPQRTSYFRTVVFFLFSNPCNFEIFKTVMKYFLKHYRVQISFNNHKGNLSP